MLLGCSFVTAWMTLQCCLVAAWIQLGCCFVASWMQLACCFVAAWMQLRCCLDAAALLLDRSLVACWSAAPHSLQSLMLDKALKLMLQAERAPAARIPLRLVPSLVPTVFTRVGRAPYKNITPDTIRLEGPKCTKYSSEPRLGIGLTSKGCLEANN